MGVWGYAGVQYMAARHAMYAIFNGIDGRAFTQFTPEASLYFASKARIKLYYVGKNFCTARRSDENFFLVTYQLKQRNFIDCIENYTNTTRLVYAKITRC